MASSGEYYDADKAAGTAPAAHEGSAHNFFSLSNIRAFLWRQRLILIGVTALVFIVGLIVTLLLPAMYTATATMRVSGGNANIVQGQDLTNPAMNPQESNIYLQTLINVMQSRNMALQVVDSLGLQDNPAVVGDELSGSDESTEELRRQVAAGVLQSNVDVQSPMGNRIIAVSYSSEDAVLSARIANAYVDSMVQNQVREGAGTNSYALTYLEEQIDEVRDRLQEAERRSIDYARENQIVGDPISAPAPLDPQAGQSAGLTSPVSVSNLAAVNSTYTSARANRIAAETLWRAAANVPATQLPSVQQSPTVQSLRQRRLALEATISDLSERYREDYPMVREMQAQIDEIDRQITEESNAIKAAIRNNYEIALRQEQALNQELERVSSATLDEQDRRVQYNIINRDAEALRSQLAALLGRYNQISAAADLQSESISWLDRAMVPAVPSSPNLILNLLMSLLGGAALATGIAVLREMFDDRIRTSEEMERKLLLPALGHTPFVSDEIPEEIEDPFSPISEAYASIRATLDHAVRRDHSVIQLTSSEAGEGKTTSATALARKYASIGRKVLLVDFDLRRPGLSRMFGGDARPEFGVLDVLYSRVPLERALLPNTIENLDILPVSEIPDNPVEVMSSSLIGEFIERYRSQYDVMLLDSSPVMGIADAPLLSRHVDAVAFVLEANRAQIRKAKIALRRLDDMHAHVVGLVLTKFRALEAGENDNYEHHYYNYNSRTA